MPSFVIAGLLCFLVIFSRVTLEAIPEEGNDRVRSQYGVLPGAVSADMLLAPVLKYKVNQKGLTVRGHWVQVSEYGTWRQFQCQSGPPYSCWLRDWLTVWESDEGVEEPPDGEGEWVETSYFDYWPEINENSGYD